MDIINARIANPPDDGGRKGLLNPLKWVTKREHTGQLYNSVHKHSYSAHPDSYSRTRFIKGLYHSYGHGGTWNNSSGNPYHYGAIFNFDFTPDG